MQKKFVIAGFALAATMALTACGSTGVFDRERPDEFAVSKAAPLEVPADLSALPTPQPGAPRPQGKDSKQEMLDAMFGAPKSN
jgi:hypothetical protein